MMPRLYPGSVKQINYLDQGLKKSDGSKNRGWKLDRTQAWEKKTRLGGNRREFWHNVSNSGHLYKINQSYHEKLFLWTSVPLSAKDFRWN